MINKETLEYIIKVCDDFINEDVKYKNDLDMDNKLTADRRRELELKNCGMRNLRSRIIQEYKKL